MTKQIPVCSFVVMNLPPIVLMLVIALSMAMLRESQFKETIILYLTSCILRTHRENVFLHKSPRHHSWCIWNVFQNLIQRKICTLCRRQWDHFQSIIKYECALYVGVMRYSSFLSMNSRASKITYILCSLKARDLFAEESRRLDQNNPHAWGIPCECPAKKQRNTKLSWIESRSYLTSCNPGSTSVPYKYHS